MNPFKKTLSRVFIIPRKLYLRRRFKIKNKSVTILSNNCIGGFLYKDFGIQYCSPTIGLQIPIMDFFKYVNNLRNYNELYPVEGDCRLFQDDFNSLGGGPIDFPCAFLGDLKILFQHEKTFSQAFGKWDRRKRRINESNIVVICWVKNDLLTDEVLRLFSKIKYKKILLTDKKVSFPNVFFLDVPKGKNWFDLVFVRRYFERIDWNRFFNEE